MVIGRLAEIQFRSLNWCKCSIWPEYVGRECEKSEFCTEGIKQYRIQKAWPNGLTPNPLFGQWFAISVKILGDFSLNCYKVKVKVKTPQLKVKLSFRCFFPPVGCLICTSSAANPPSSGKTPNFGTILHTSTTWGWTYRVCCGNGPNKIHSLANLTQKFVREIKMHFQGGNAISWNAYKWADFCKLLMTKCKWLCFSWRHSINADID